MSITHSQRPNRELPLLILTGLFVAAIVVPLWQWSGHVEAETEYWAKFTPERIGRLLLGPEQIACYVAFVWASLILLRRWLEVRRQRQAFSLGLLPTDEGARILPSEARPLARKVDYLTAHRGPLILANMVRLALRKYAVSGSAPDVGEIVRTQADVEMGRMVTSLSTVQYLAWAIPSLGFLGTVRGLAGGMTMAGVSEESLQKFIDQATRHLTIAFDCTFVALTLSIMLMLLINTVQRMEEMLVIDCQAYCQEHLLLRLYDPQSGSDKAGVREPVEERSLRVY